MSKRKLAKILTIAGSDNSGGAGIQGDIKTITALGGYAHSAITAITVQNTQGVSQIEVLPGALVAAQIGAILDDIGADVIKIGMLGNADNIKCVANALAGKNIPIVLDPVMVAKGGACLLSEQDISLLIAQLFPQTHLLTPNAPEAHLLSGIEITDIAGQRAAAEHLLEMGPGAVLVKGGHITGDVVFDVLLWQYGELIFESPRQMTKHTHGTGCTLSSAIATYLAQGLPLSEAVGLARKYVQGAIRTAPGFGAGHGPLNHLWRQNET